MSSPAQQVRSRLITLGVGSNGGTWPIFVSQLTTAPDAQLAVYDTPGPPPNPKWLLDYPTVMIHVRGDIDGYDAAIAKAKDIKDALLGTDPIVIDGDRWDSVTMNGDINFLAYDDNKRPLISMNLGLIIEPATSALTNREAL